MFTSSLCRKGRIDECSPRTLNRITNPIIGGCGFEIHHRGGINGANELISCSICPRDKGFRLRRGEKGCNEEEQDKKWDCFVK